MEKKVKKPKPTTKPLNPNTLADGEPRPEPRG